MDYQQKVYSKEGMTSSALLKKLGQYQVPRDDQDARYIQSFLCTETDEMKEFFDRYGFVVVRDVLTDQDCQRTVSDMYDILEEEGKFKRNDVTTWDHWPKNGMEKHGMPSRSPLFTKQALRNRTNPKVFQVFATLLGTENLLVNHDRFGFLRPTRSVAIGNQIIDKKHWKTATNIHMDMNPWGYMGDGSKVIETLAGLRYGHQLNHFIFENNQISNEIYSGLHLQGVLNLADNYEEDGGFLVVPGFKHYFNEWLEIFKDSDLARIAADRNSVPFPDKDPLNQYAIRVPMRAGSLVVWDQRSPHGAKANDSSRVRCAQFIKMFPAEPMDANRANARCSTLLTIVRKNGFENELTPLAMRLLGFVGPDQEEQKDKAHKDKDFKKKSRVQGGWGERS